MLRLTLVTAFAILAAGAPLQAAEPERETARYTFIAVPDGALRLDTHTGAVSHCARGEGGWACRAVPDEQAPAAGEVAGVAKPAAKAPAKDAPTGDVYVRVPTEADLDRVVGALERAWERLVDRMHALRGRI